MDRQSSKDEYLIDLARVVDQSSLFTGRAWPPGMLYKTLAFH